MNRKGKMNDKNIYLKYDEEGRELKGVVHAWNYFADYTLCGEGCCEIFKYTDAKINCPVCIGIIEYCKGFRKNIDYKKSGK